MTDGRYVLADSTPLYAAADTTDGMHQRAQAELRQLRVDNVQIAVSVSTLLECHRLVLFRLGRHIAERWLREVVSSTLLVYPVRQDYESAFVTLNRYSDQPITLADAVLHAIGARLDLAIWTYDHHFDILRANRWHPEVR